MGRGGFPIYTCVDLDGALGLNAVRTARGYDGRVAPRSKYEFVTWGHRLDHEAGLRSPRPVPMVLPDGLPASTLQVAEGWRRLVGLRDERWGSEPFMFARSFVMAWCGVSDEQAKHGVKRLEALGAMVRVGKHPTGPILWRPGGADEATGDGRAGGWSR